MSYVKQNFKSKRVLMASQLNDMDDQIAKNEQSIAKLTVMANNFQEKLVAGDNITIEGNVISADIRLSEVDDDVINSVVESHLNTVVNNQLDDLRSEDLKIAESISSIEMMNSFDVLKEMVRANTVKGGITFTWDGDSCHAVGTRNGTAMCNLYNNLTAMPQSMKPGDDVYMDFTSTDTKLLIQAYYYAADGSSTHDSFATPRMFHIPDDTVGMILRIYIDSSMEGKYIDATISGIRFANALSNVQLTKKVENHENLLYVSQEYLPPCDLNDVTTTGSWLLVDTNKYDSTPNNARTGVLHVFRYKNTIYQEFAELSKQYIHKRWIPASGGWREWQLVNPDVEQNVYNVTQNFSEYSNSYTVNASPVITPNDDYVLNSTNDSTDRTADIVTMLNQTGVCRLGVGVFYVSGVDMPDDTMLTGCGPKTKVILKGSDSTEGYAVKMGSRCTVTDMAIMGNTTDYTDNGSTYPADAAYVNRHGILWQGNASGANNSIPRRGTISRCYISNFTGGGITCYDSGLNVISGMNASDCWIWHCYAGINIQFHSEFTRWTNISCNMCHYGAINNGGNQTFANCGFSKNIVGMLIDNSANQSKNNSHGSVVNCVFDHSDSNVGVGIKLLGVTNGELFSNIQLFYSSIEIGNCKGISLSNFDYGRDTTKELSGIIKVTGGSFVVMDKFMCRTIPPITVDSTSKLILTDCYTWTGDKIVL